MIAYKRVSNEKELKQLLILQQKNLFTELETTESIIEGFVTVQHTFDILKRMNRACRHIIVSDRHAVVGYALVMLPSFKNEIPILTPMFEAADTLLIGRNYVVMGQICIEKAYRRKGLFRGIYQFYKNELEHTFDGVLTEVATENQRSLQAHKSVGFEIIRTQVTENSSWELLYWDWTG